MTPFPDLIERDGLRLRPLSPADGDAVCRHLSDPETARWLAAVTRPFGPAEYAALLDHGQQDDTHLRGLEVGGVLAGCLCIGPALWYWLASEHRGRGLMRRALTAALAARFSGPAPPVTATCHVDNIPSQKLLTALGFALSPRPRRMFFHGDGAPASCQDYLMAPEQWHLLHPPRISLGPLTLRPALQKDAPLLARMQSGRWPEAGALPAFIEEHRYRGGPSGLFAIHDADRRCIGMALVAAGRTDLRFLDATEEARHRSTLDTALSQGLTAVLSP